MTLGELLLVSHNMKVSNSMRPGRDWGTFLDHAHTMLSQNGNLCKAFMVAWPNLIDTWLMHHAGGSLRWRMRMKHGPFLRTLMIILHTMLQLVVGDLHLKPKPSSSANPKMATLSQKLDQFMAAIAASSYKTTMHDPCSVFLLACTLLSPS
jgi:hypothetical protein